MLRGDLRTEQETCSKDTSFNDHDQLSVRATHAEPPRHTRRIQGRVSHSGRGQRGDKFEMSASRVKALRRKLRTAT